MNVLQFQKRYSETEIRGILILDYLSESIKATRHEEYTDRDPAYYAHSHYGAHVHVVRFHVFTMGTISYVNHKAMTCTCPRSKSDEQELAECQHKIIALAQWAIDRGCQPNYERIGRFKLSKEMEKECNKERMVA